MVRRIVALLPVAVLALAVLVTAAAPAIARTAIGGMRLGIHDEGVTRFVMDISETMDFKVVTFADPYRVVVEAPTLDWSPEAQLKKPWGAVRGVSGDTGHLVLELKQPAAVKQAFIIPPRDGVGWRFVLDLKDVTREAFVATAQPAPRATAAPKAAAVAKPAPAARPDARPEPRPAATVAAPAPEPPPARGIVVVSPNAQQPAPVVVAAAPPAAVAAPVPPPARPMESRTVGGSPMLSAPMPPPPERPVAERPIAAVVEPAVPSPVVTPVSLPAPPPPVVLAEPERKRNDGPPVIVIDPGHGGVDPGAIGVSGIYEKNITLAVARELKEALEKNGRFRVYLTRDRDVFIRLRDRIAIARQYNAELFVSLHADAVQNPQIRGLSVYTLSQNASDGEAQALAEKENKADLIAGIDLSHESADVANILIDLAQRETMNRSAVFAGDIVDEVGRDQSLLGNTHRFAGFAVLKAPDVPAVLVEMGYLSNEQEERDLRQPHHRVKLAKSIARAVDRFFVQTQKAKRP
ncbi:MAG: N-acetylmuramoyl-L-alanine amidase [Magnetospirillum sp.]|nr:N-acetylmuramoyl-L-alanine amidase [Magnetospirillum sp.]